MSTAPTDDRCGTFSDYVLENYIFEEARFWTNYVVIEAFWEVPNGCESFHHHFNAQFYTLHSAIFPFIDPSVINKLQCTVYIKMRSSESIGLLSKTERENLEFLIQQTQKFKIRQSLDLYLLIAFHSSFESDVIMNFSEALKFCPFYTLNICPIVNFLSAPLYCFLRPTDLWIRPNVNKRFFL